MITPEDARSLAIAYHAFSVAVDNQDHLGIQVWGRILLESQQKTGVELHSKLLLNSCVRSSEDYRELEELTR
jgi:hypothetical protein